MHIKVGPGGTLRRALGTFDLVLLNIVTIIGLRWLSTAAQIGPSSLTLWGVALLTFFIPSALAVLELIPIGLNGGDASSSTPSGSVFDDRLNQIDVRVSKTLRFCSGRN